MVWQESQRHISDWLRKVGRTSLSWTLGRTGTYYEQVTCIMRAAGLATSRDHTMTSAGAIFTEYRARRKTNPEKSDCTSITYTRVRHTPGGVFRNDAGGVASPGIFLVQRELARDVLYIAAQGFRPAISLQAFFPSLYPYCSQHCEYLGVTVMLGVLRDHKRNSYL